MKEQGVNTPECHWCKQPLIYDDKNFLYKCTKCQLLIDKRLFNSNGYKNGKTNSHTLSYDLVKETREEVKQR